MERGKTASAPTNTARVSIAHRIVVKTSAKTTRPPAPSSSNRLVDRWCARSQAAIFSRRRAVSAFIGVRLTLVPSPLRGRVRVGGPTPALPRKGGGGNGGLGDHCPSNELRLARDRHRRHRQAHVP